MEIREIVARRLPGRAHRQHETEDKRLKGIKTDNQKQLYKQISFRYTESADIIVRKCMFEKLFFFEQKKAEKETDMKKGLRSGRVFTLLLALLMCLALVPMALDSEKAEAATDPTTFWDSAVDGNGWSAWSSSWTYVKTVKASGVSVDHYDWEGNTCNVVLDSATAKDASFTFATTSYVRTASSSGVKLNGTNAAGASASRTLELSDGAASITVQPYYSSRTGTTKTFSFTIDGEGIDATYVVDLPGGEGYEVNPVAGYESPVASGSSFKFTVDIQPGYKKGQNFAVKANGSALTADANGVYTIEKIKNDQTVTVEDVVDENTTFYWNVTLPSSPVGYEVTPASGSESPVTEGGSYSFTVTISDGYAKNSSFAVKANGAVLTAGSGDKYTIENIQADQTVEVAGVQKIWDVTVNNGTGYTISPEGSSASPVFSGGDYTFKVNIAEGYKKGADFAVKSNGTALTPNADGIYTISNIQEDKNVTVEDVVTSDTVNQFRITLPDVAGATAAPVEGYSSPVDEGEDYQFTVTIEDGYMASASFAVKANGTELTPDDKGVYKLENVRTHQEITVTGLTQMVSVTAPKGSTIAAGKLDGSFKYTWSDPVKTVSLDDGRVKSYFNAISGTSFYRVQNPKGVTYWDYQTMTAGKSYEATETDLHMDDGDFNKDTIYKDFTYNYLDLGDVYLNINERGYLPLKSGATRELDVFRNWQAIENFTNAKIAVPDAHYEVVDIEGNPSDLVTIVPDKHNTCLATIKAGDSAGMAVVKVTYDAMIHKQGMASGWGAGGKDSTRFGAIWPECTGVFVVTVDKDGSSIDLGMTINTDTPIAHAGKVAGNNIDAEHDLLYYQGDDGAEYTFKPAEGATVTVARPKLTANSLAFNGFSADGVTADDEGNVTVTGLMAGRNIVKVEKDGVANYQVISARKIGVKATLSDGKEVNLNKYRFSPGDQITLTLSNVNSPQEKLATCYNNSFSIAYFGEDKPTTRLTSTGVGHQYGQYNFSSLDQQITVKIPEDWDKDTYSVINGGVALGGFSGCAAGGHRGKVTYNTASGMATGSGGSGVLGKLPDLVFKMKTAGDSSLKLIDENCKVWSATQIIRYDDPQGYVDDDLLPTYKVVVPANSTFQIVEDPEAFPQVDERHVDDFATGDEINITGGENRITIDKSELAGKAGSVDEIFAVAGHDAERFHMDSVTNDIAGLKVYGAVEPAIPETGLDGAYYLFIEFDENAVSDVVEHDLAHVEKKDAECEKAGHEEHWKCARCNRLFSDGDAEKEIDESEVTISATGHSWGEITYTWAADNSSVTAKRICENDPDHKETETKGATPEEKTPATCMAKGVNTYTSAAFDNDAFQIQTKDVDDIPIDLENGHKWGDWEEAEPSTCVKAGQKVCRCEHNENHTKSQDLALLDHELTATPRVEATCTKQGNIDFWTCGKCSQLFSDENGQKVINKSDTIIAVDPDAHAWNDGEETTPPTCKSKGVMTFTCKHDNNHTKTSPIDRIPHKVEAVKGKAATCTKEGVKAHHKCTVCGGLFTDAAGKTAITKDQLKIPANGHKYGAWKKLNAKQHQKICASDKSHVVKENHKWDKGKVTKKATPNQTGVKTFTCKTCKATNTMTLSKTPDLLVARATASGNNAARITWNGTKGAQRYVIYLSKCDGKDGIKEIKKVSGKTRSWSKSGLKKNESYKFKVVAQKKKNGKYVTFRSSRSGHFVTGDVKGNMTNAKSLTLNRTNVTLKKNGSMTISAKVTKVKAGKKHMTGHVDLLRYTSNDPSVADVNAKGRITAKKAGVAKIYVQTINGMWKVVTVTVK